MRMAVKALKGGKLNANAAGYGLIIRKQDRDRYFRRSRDFVSIHLGKKDEPVKIHITPSFWRKCSELRTKQIGRRLIDNAYSK